MNYAKAHKRVKKLWGLAAQYTCFRCGSPAKEWAYDGTDPEQRYELHRGLWPVYYSEWPEFYAPMCTGCHRKKDRAAWSERQTHFGCGHERTLENTYSRKSKVSKECRTCKSARKRNPPARKVFQVT